MSKSICCCMLCALALTSVSVYAISDREFQKTEFYRIKQMINHNRAQIDNLKRNEKSILNRNHGDKAQMKIEIVRQMKAYQEQITLLEDSYGKLLEKKRSRLDLEKKIAKMRLDQFSKDRFSSSFSRQNARKCWERILEEEKKLNEIEAMVSTSETKRSSAVPAKKPSYVKQAVMPPRSVPVFKNK